MYSVAKTKLEMLTCVKFNKIKIKHQNINYFSFISCLNLIWCSDHLQYIFITIAISGKFPTKSFTLSLLEFILQHSKIFLD